MPHEMESKEPNRMIKLAFVLLGFAIICGLLFIVHWRKRPIKIFIFRGLYLKLSFDLNFVILSDCDCHWLSIVTLWALEEKNTFLAPIQLSVCQKDVYFDKFCNKCLSLLGYNLYKPVYLIDNTKNDDFAIKNLWIAFVI